MATPLSRSAGAAPPPPPETDGKRVSDVTGTEPTAAFVQSLARGLAVIEAFNQGGDALTVAEAARRTGLSRASARRALLTLQALGYARSDGQRFDLTPRCLRLGFAYLGSGELWGAAQQPMAALVETIGESCSAGVLDGTDVVYVARVPSRARVMSVALGVGSRLPAIKTSMGRVLLAALPPVERDRMLADPALWAPTASAASPADAGAAALTLTTSAALARELDRVASQGHALVDQELEAGLRSVAVPVRDASGRVIAALNVGTHAGRVSLGRLRDEILPALKECADEIHQTLGGRR